MTRPVGNPWPSGSQGLTLVEVMIALVLISIGILALARLMPAGSRSELASRMQSTAGQFADEPFESLRGQLKTSTALSAGRHPAAGYDSLGTSKKWLRYYSVSQMSAPLDSLLKVQAVVRWTSSKPESVSITGYLMP